MKKKVSSVPQKNNKKVLHIALIAGGIIVPVLVFLSIASRNWNKGPSIAVFFDDPINKRVKVYLKEPNDNQIGVNQEDYLLKEDGTVAKGSFDNFIVSPDNNFLFYSSHTAQGTNNFYIFIKQANENKYLDLDIDNQNFTKDGKYFYSCGNEAAIYQLPELKPIYLSGRKGTYFKCSPGENKKNIIYTEYKDSSQSELLSTYQFSPKTAIFEKI